jgi:hypothetical protein
VEADIGEGAGGDAGDGHADHVVGAEGEPERVQQGERVRVHPARLAKLQDVHDVAGEQGGEFTQPVAVKVPARRQLVQDGPERLAEPAHPADETGEWFADILELLVVRQEAVGLDRVAKPGGAWSRHFKKVEASGTR